MHPHAHSSGEDVIAKDIYEVNINLWLNKVKHGNSVCVWHLSSEEIKKKFKENTIAKGERLTHINVEANKKVLMKTNLKSFRK